MRLFIETGLSEQVKRYFGGVLLTFQIEAELAQFAVVIASEEVVEQRDSIKFIISALVIFEHFERAAYIPLGVEIYHSFDLEALQHLSFAVYAFHPFTPEHEAGETRERRSLDFLPGRCKLLIASKQLF